MPTEPQSEHQSTVVMKCTLDTCQIDAILVIHFIIEGFSTVIHTLFVARWSNSVIKLAVAYAYSEAFQ